MKVSKAVFLTTFLVVACGLTVFFTNTSVAASFDCKKAMTAVEQLICADTGLSELDTTLGNLYSSTKKDHPDLVKNQKEWLQETRNACTTGDCLKNAYTARIATLKLYVDCPINDLSLQGNWKRVMAGPFEEMSFRVEYGEKVFISWLHQRPEMTGKWSINKCVIHIEDKNSSQLEFDLQVKGFNKNVLRIVDLDGNAEGSYKKVR